MLSKGKKFEYRNNKFIVLDCKQNGVLAIFKEPLKQIFCFDSRNKNDWEYSELRGYLNGVFLSTYFKKSDLLLITSNTIADDGTYHGTGKCQDYITLLSDELYRKYRPLIPKTYHKGLWSLTPFSCTKDIVSAQRVIKTDGTLIVSLPLTYNAVMPVVMFKKDCLFED